ncbi:hypothetical protein, partial [Enterococcus italicus]|uniref:hypothetical protein n=1 Tax=Enterococcus italicus TaxID=246144 RepID=UPI002072AF19
LLNNPVLPMVWKIDIPYNFFGGLLVVLIQKNRLVGAREEAKRLLTQLIYSFILWNQQSTLSGF